MRQIQTCHLLILINVFHLPVSFISCVTTYIFCPILPFISSLTSYTFCLLFIIHEFSCWLCCHSPGNLLYPLCVFMLCCISLPRLSSLVLPSRQRKFSLLSVHHTVLTSYIALILLPHYFFTWLFTPSSYSLYTFLHIRALFLTSDCHMFFCYYCHVFPFFVYVQSTSVVFFLLQTHVKKIHKLQDLNGSSLQLSGKSLTHCLKK